MESIVLVGFLAFFVASLAVGLRLLALWMRTRELPELLIGVGVLGIGPAGFGLMLLGSHLIGVGSTTASNFCFGIGTLTIFAGVFAKYVFNYRVYHPDHRLVQILVGALGIALAAIYVYRLVSRSFVPSPTPDAVALCQTSLQVGALLWGSVEAVRYWRLMRRRVAIGLGDPVVANRFLLWAIGAGSAGLGTALGTVASMWIGRPSLDIPWVVAASSAHGMVAAIAMWLAFVPPAAYLRYVRRTIAPQPE